MGLINCPACDGKVSYEASSCPHCGKPHPGARVVDDAAAAKYFFIMIFLMILAFIVVMLLPAP